VRARAKREHPQGVCFRFQKNRSSKTLHKAASPTNRSTHGDQEVSQSAKADWLAQHDGKASASKREAPAPAYGCLRRFASSKIKLAGVVQTQRWQDGRAHAAKLVFCAHAKSLRSCLRSCVQQREQISPQGETLQAKDALASLPTKSPQRFGRSACAPSPEQAAAISS